jgi:ferredoxin
MASSLRVNPITCEGHGLCAELLPELIRLDDWGYPIIDQEAIPERMLPYAKRAANACPTLALLLQAERSRAPQAAAQHSERPPEPASSPARRRTRGGTTAQTAG